MKILQICAGDFFSTYGGGQVYVKNLVDAFLNQRFVNLDVISFIDGITKRENKVYKSVKLHEVPEDISEEALSELIGAIAPDVIHAHSHKRMVCSVGYAKGIPVVVTAHHGGLWCPAGTAMNYKDEICTKKINHKDCLPCVLRNTRTGLSCWYPLMKHLSLGTYIKLGNYLSKKNFIPFITPIGGSALHIQRKKQEWKEIAEKCTVIIAPSYRMAEAMEANGMPADKIKVISHGIPKPVVKPPFPDIENGKIKFFYTGRICYVKGIHILLEAFSCIKNPYIELHLIGGAGNKKEKLYQNRLCEKYAADKRIIWHGKISPEKVYGEISDLHIAVSPSIYLEAFGLNIAEALALGKPVISTHSGGGDIQVIDGENGWLVNSNDIKSLQQKFKDILRMNQEDLYRISNNCNSKYLFEHVSELMNVYKGL